MKKVLVTGGAGYIGSQLSRLLLSKGYSVRVIDCLMFGGESIIDLLDHENFEFMAGDVRNQEDLNKAIGGVDMVVHLAAIVGDPACKKFPDAAKAINFESSKNLFELADKNGVEKFVFVSTCSNYGKMEDPTSFVNENSKLSPISLYAETKVQTEEFLLNRKGESKCIPTVLRFSTVYGLSPRVRFDLTVNEFTRELALGKELVVFGEQFWRPYCHVNDLARGVELVLASSTEKVAFEVFNVGDTQENYQKQMIVDEILKQIPEGRVRYVKKDEDPRDYRVSFDKIKERLGFQVTKRLPDGIEEIKMALDSKFFPNAYDSKYSNIEGARKDLI